MKQNKLNQHSILSSKLREIITALEDQSVANPHTKSLIELWSWAAALPTDLFNTNYCSCQKCSILLKYLNC